MTPLPAQESIEIATPDGNFDGWIFGSGRGRRPGIVMVPEIFGVNASLRETAQRYADEGYVVLAMDIFWRMQRRVDLGYDKESFDQARDFHARFDYAHGCADLQAAVTTLRARPDCTGKVGVVGFCLGGTMGYLAGSRTDADAAVGYYGTRIDSFLEDGQRISRPTMLHLGRLDHRTLPPVMAKIMAAVDGNPNVTLYPYDEAGHAFANHHRPDTYMPDVTRLADQRTFAFFRSKLASSTS